MNNNTRISYNLNPTYYRIGDIDPAAITLAKELNTAYADISYTEQHGTMDHREDAAAVYRATRRDIDESGMADLVEELAAGFRGRFVNYMAYFLGAGWRDANAADLIWFAGRFVEAYEPERVGVKRYAAKAWVALLG